MVAFLKARRRSAVLADGRGLLAGVEWAFSFPTGAPNGAEAAALR